VTLGSGLSISEEEGLAISGNFSALMVCTSGHAANFRTFLDFALFRSLRFEPNDRPDRFALPDRREAGWLPSARPRLPKIPVHCQLCKHLNPRGHETRCSTAHKQMFLSG
jgi:hypothetical protein